MSPVIGAVIDGAATSQRAQLARSAAAESGAHPDLVARLEHWNDVLADPYRAAEPLRSALRTVDSRCAMMMTVRPLLMAAMPNSRTP